MKQRHSFFKRNGLLLIFLSLMIATLTGQVYTGWHEHNQEREEKGLSLYLISEYVTSGHFIQSTFENWESEFLQMGLYVFLTIFLFQPQAHVNAPWPVKKGGLYLTIYKNSLSLVFLILFILSFFLHAHGTKKTINEEEGQALTLWQVFFENRFWFESLQNWQSEFLSVAAIVFFSIYLRQQGSPESKPVDSSHDETGK
jgi:hypothetical protein